MMADINRAINGLNEDFRKPFVMYYIGYKYLEIADQLQIPIGTVKNRIHIARKELKRYLKIYSTN
jgi:RNA polymerase sigma-70 factor (ECF subfamily)